MQCARHPENVNLPVNCNQSVNTTLTCIIKYSGNVRPLLTWTSNDENVTLENSSEDHKTRMKRDSSTTESMASDKFAYSYGKTITLNWKRNSSIYYKCTVASATINTSYSSELPSWNSPPFGCKYK